MSQRAQVLLAVATLTGATSCDRRSGEAPRALIAQPPQRLIAVDSANRSTSTHTGALGGPGAPPSPGAQSAPTSAGTSEETSEQASEQTSDGDEILVGEARERDPRSDTIKVKVIVDQRRQAHVVWGRKDFGVAPLEIERPRNSGPLDLVVIAPGYLPYHARAFTDRDDLISVHLSSAAEAPQLLGYRASDVPPAATTPRPATANQNIREIRPSGASKAGAREATKLVPKDAPKLVAKDVIKDGRPPAQPPQQPTNSGPDPGAQVDDLTATGTATGTATEQPKDEK